MGVRPSIACRPAGQGTRRGEREWMDRRRHEARLGQGVSVRPLSLASASAHVSEHGAVCWRVYALGQTAAFLGVRATFRTG
jgi:hypothetical protein